MTISQCATDTEHDVTGSQGLLDPASELQLWAGPLGGGVGYRKGGKVGWYVVPRTPSRGMGNCTKPSMKNKITEGWKEQIGNPGRSRRAKARRSSQHMAKLIQNCNMLPSLDVPACIFLRQGFVNSQLERTSLLI
ncbi:hypothetical protein DPEC_G00126820 [Dallia pectoralis]|uniref:Uncharacterized protein n=1 Tax=Dallia pectoralis TaxID=75939 RepID=A0ACC2GS79_DALPE|nr:hypothetical protein DPEC_G00126820 [Dallia pectoralis]